jgi:farnesol dehydrogenase
MKVLLTGGTGFLGGRVGRVLMEAGHQVSALVRPGSPRKAPDGATVIDGDIADAASVRKAAAGCDAVVHTAALVKLWMRDASTFDATNVDGLRHVLNSGVPRIIYTSSFIALGPTDGTVADEGWKIPNRTTNNDYERTKAKALDIAREAAGKGAQITTLFPGVVYGPGTMTDGSLMTKTVRDFLDDKIPGILGAGDRRISYAYIDDVARGHLLALEKGQPGDEFILGGENRTILEVLEILSRITGIKAPSRKIPYGVASFLGWLQRQRAILTGKEPELTDEVVRIYKREWAYDSSRAKSTLGYSITPLEEGLKKTVEWLRSVKKDGAS